MKKTSSDKLNLDNVLDISYEPKKDRYTVLSKNGSRQELAEHDFLYILGVYRYCELIKK